MSDSKSPAQDGFFRKVAKFVANPTTDWRDVNARPEDAKLDGGYDKEELKAMIERKQRNDFVRKREFDMLRKIRREGITGDGLAGLNLSHLDDSEPPRTSRVDGEVKAKIDAIERQMVGETFPAAPPSRAPQAPIPAMDMFSSTTLPGDATAVPTARQPLNDAPLTDLKFRPGSASAPARAAPPVAKPSPSPTSGGRDTQLPSTTSGMVRSQPMPLAAKKPGSEFGDPFAVEVNEIAHDPELDEAVIAFANADFDQCERSLTTLTGQGGGRRLHAETWLVLFDFYRAIGEQAKFESLAVDYAEQFGWSAPQWFSMPQQVAAATAQQKASSAPTPGHKAPSTVGWICPSVIDLDAVKRLRTQTLQLPLPWVLDWSGVTAVEPEACGLLTSLFRVWARDPIDMLWVGGEQLLQVLSDGSPVAVRDVDPSVWLLKLEVLRLTNRPDQFDVAAIDYCVTYEVSPPSWEPARCTARLTADPSTGSPLSVISEVSTGFVESQTHDDPSMGQIATVELSGQLTGDISPTLRAAHAQLGAATTVSVGCARLIRVDFIAAGDLLNWVLSRRGENRTVQFEDAHRLVALFFGAMGINEHAKVKGRNI